MNVHKNARLTPHGRERIVRQVESGQTPKAVGEAAGVCPRTVRKWVSRYRDEGLAGLRDSQFAAPTAASADPSSDRRRGRASPPPPAVGPASPVAASGSYQWTLTRIPGHNRQ